MVHLTPEKAEVFSQTWATTGPELVEKLKCNLFAPKKVQSKVFFLSSLASDCLFLFSRIYTANPLQFVIYVLQTIYPNKSFTTDAETTLLVYGACKPVILVIHAPVVPVLV